jgi:hypothetical protein
MIDGDDADLSPPGITTAAPSGFKIELRARANYRHVCPNNFVSAHKMRAFGDIHWESGRHARSNPYGTVRGHAVRV